MGGIRLVWEVADLTPKKPSGCHMILLHTPIMSCLKCFTADSHIYINIFI